MSNDLEALMAVIPTWTGPDGAPLATLPTDLGPEAVAEELAKWVR